MLLAYIRQHIKVAHLFSRTAKLGTEKLNTRPNQTVYKPV